MRLEDSSKGAHLSLGRLGNQFGNLAGRIAGVHPIVGNLANVLGDFAIGGAVTVGVLAGVAAIAVAYDKLTDSARKAMQASDKLIESYEKAARVSKLGVGGQQQADIQDIAAGTAAHTKRAAFLTSAASFVGGTSTGVGSFLLGMAGSDVEATRKAIGATQQAVNEYGIAVGKANDEIAAKAKALRDAALAKEKEITAEKARQQSLLIQYNELMARTYGTLGTIGHDFSGGTMAQQLKNAQANQLPSILETVQALTTASMPDVSMPNVSLNDSVTKAQIKTAERMGILLDRSDKNTQALQNTMLNVAQIIASTVSQALNIGGGGRGAGIGGAIGSVLGAGLTVGAGVLTSGLWGIGGALVGSLVGGLFDHKKAVNNNTAAIQQLTQAMLLNAPRGFKIDQRRYDATYVTDLGKAVRRYTSRGGVNPLVVGT